MNTNTTEQSRSRIFHHCSGWTCVLLAAVVAMLCGSASAKARHRKHNAGPFQYAQSNLISDLPGVAALQDTNLVNAWGISFPTSGPFWVSGNGSGLALVYSVTNDESGASQVTKLPLEVSIPGEGNVTGQVFNNTGGFHSNAFLFVSEDGTISGWRGALGTTAETLTTRMGAVYKGVCLITTANGPTLLAANFSEGTLDVYDSSATLVAQHSDHRAPAGYAPFNVQLVAGHVFVTFAKQDADKEDDVRGPGNGLIDVFNTRTGTFHRFVTGTDAGGRNNSINSPWGLALSPASFGNHGDQLLVGNFGSGTIMTFEADGDFRGLLEGVDGQPVQISGLWALTFGNGGRAGVPNTLYFSAGPDGESHGLFGSIEPVRVNRHGGHDGDDDDDDDQGEDGGGDRH